MATLPQIVGQKEPKEPLQVLIRRDAASRLRVAAAIRRQPLGELVSELLEEHLPEPPTEKPTAKQKS